MYNKLNKGGDTDLIYKIAEVRRSKGISQEELAIKSGVSRSIISNLETGAADVTTTGTLEKIASALEVKVTDLFFEANV